VKTEHDFRLMDQRIEATLAAHAENLKQWIEAGCCPRCRAHHLIELNERNITFKCSKGSCGWSAIYPIRTLGNSERAQRDGTLDLVAIAEKEVLDKARTASQWLVARLHQLPVSREVDALISAVSLLEAREEVVKQLEGEATGTLRDSVTG